MTSKLSTRLIAASDAISRFGEVVMVEPKTAAESLDHAARRMVMILPDKFVALTADTAGQILGGSMVPKGKRNPEGESVMFGPLFGLGWDIAEAVPQLVLAVRDAAIGLGRLATDEASSPPASSTGALP